MTQNLLELELLEYAWSKTKHLYELMDEIDAEARRKQKSKLIPTIEGAKA